MVTFIPVYACLSTHAPASSFCALMCVRSLKERNRWRGQADSPFVLDCARAPPFVVVVGRGLHYSTGTTRRGSCSLVWFVPLCCTCERQLKEGLKSMLSLFCLRGGVRRKEGLRTMTSGILATINSHLRKLRLVPDGLKFRHSISAGRESSSPGYFCEREIVESAAAMKTGNEDGQ